MKLYVVTTGEYSDHRIQGIFSSKEIGEEFSSIFYDPNEIEEYILDRNGDLIKAGYKPYVVVMDKRGGVKKAEKGFRETYRKGADIYFFPEEPEIYFPVEYIGCMRVDILSKSEEEAIRAANEHRVMFLVLDMWGKNNIDCSCESCRETFKDEI
jgi:hypothetical protein